MTSPFKMYCHLYTHSDVSNRGMGSEDVDDDDVVDLEKMAEDYAQYLVINSKQDVSESAGGLNQ